MKRSTKATPPDVPVYLFKQGRNFESQKFFGAHLETVGEEEGVRFRVWAPRAKAVSIVGDFNSWIPSATPMTNIDPQGGIWERFIPGLKEFDIYKYCVTTPAERSFIKVWISFIDTSSSRRSRIVSRMELW